MAERGPILNVAGLRKSFGGLVAVDDVSLHVTEGEICGLIGPNGSGKSTTFNLISGLMRPDEGSITFAGQEIAGAAPWTVSALGVGRAFQIVRPLAQATCVENLLPGLLYSGQASSVTDARARAEELLGLVGLGKKCTSLGGDLTLWEKKSLEVAKGLSVGSRMLLLDEVFAGLSPKDVERTIELVRRIHADLRLTILFVEHVMRATMALCSRIVVLSFGRVIAEGTPQEVVRDPNVVEVYLGRQHRGENLDA